MPFFSFILKSQSNKELVNTIKKFHKTTDIEKKYFSKNTQLWKILNNKKNHEHLDYIKIEKRKKLIKIKNNILFCLPPNIGLGDAIVRVSWDAPVNNGGSEILGYIVTALPSGNSIDIDAETNIAIFDNLNLGNEYYFISTAI